VKVIGKIIQRAVRKCGAHNTVELISNKDNTKQAYAFRLCHNMAEVCVLPRAVCSYSPAGAVAKYCDEYVCLCVCLSASISPKKPHARSLPIFCACCLCPWLGPPPACLW